jgi:hypothetical protein
VLDALRITDEEIAGVRFRTLDQATELPQPYVWRRAVNAIETLTSGRARYFHRAASPADPASQLHPYSARLRERRPICARCRKCLDAIARLCLCSAPRRAVANRPKRKWGCAALPADAGQGDPRTDSVSAVIIGRTETRHHPVRMILGPAGCCTVEPMGFLRNRDGVELAGR